MLELLTISPPVDDFGGYSGPGPQELIGNYVRPGTPKANNGYYGEVSADEFINGNEFFNLTSSNNIGLPLPVQNAGWLKFNLDRKILFVSKVPLRKAILRSQLSDLGMVYGEKTITVGTDRFRVKILKCSTYPDSSVASGSSVIDPYVPGSDMSRTLWNVLSPTVVSVYEGEKWGDLSNSDLVQDSGGTYSLSTETTQYQGNNFHAALNKNMRSISTVGQLSGTVNNDLGWRPVLELIK